MIQSIVSKLPPSFLRRLGRLQYESPVLGSMVKFVSKLLLQGEGTIKYGLGKGLKFDARGGAAGYLLDRFENKKPYGEWISASCLTKEYRCSMNDFRSSQAISPR